MFIRCRLSTKAAKMTADRHNLKEFRGFLPWYQCRCYENGHYKVYLFQQIVNYEVINCCWEWGLRIGEGSKNRPL
jgi:hypothetical protein